MYTEILYSLLAFTNPPKPTFSSLYFRQENINVYIQLQPQHTNRWTVLQFPLGDSPEIFCMTDLTTSCVVESLSLNVNKFSGNIPQANISRHEKDRLAISLVLQSVFSISEDA